MCATFAIDVDDTLYCFNTLARNKVSEVAKATGDDTLIRAAYAPWTEWRTPADLLPIQTWMDIIGLCHQDDVIWAQQPFEGVYSTLWKIINSGHDIIYISNRAESAKGATANWLEIHGFPYINNYDDQGNSLSERVELVCTSKPKGPFVAHCQFIIDDRPKTLVEFVYDFHWKHKHGSESLPRKGFGLHREYNAALTDVPGVYLAPTWGLLESHMTRKGLIE